MKLLNWLLVISILLIPMTSNALFTNVFDDMENHRWLPEGFGGEAPSLTYDSTRFGGTTVLRVSFTGTGSYGFLRTDNIPYENWSQVTAVQVDIYYEDSTTGNSPTSKFEAKKDGGPSIEAMVIGLNKNVWETRQFALTTTLNYSTVAWVLFNIESFTGFSAMTAYFDNMKLLLNNGSIKSWDDFDGLTRAYSYGGSFDVTKYFSAPYEVRSNNQAHPSSPGNAAYVAWNYTGGATYAELAATGLSEDWNTDDAQSLKYDLYTSNTSARYKIFLWDGSNGYAPVSQTVSNVSTWTNLTFDISSATIAGASPSFNRSNITEVKIVVEYLDVAGAATGEAYFDNVDRENLVPVELSIFEAVILKQ